jgi:hypothetical protein
MSFDNVIDIYSWTSPCHDHVYHFTCNTDIKDLTQRI